VVIAATNRIDVLDPALIRSGRFDRHITVSAPAVKAREEILAVHAQKVPLAADVDLAVVAKGTPGFSGADLEALVNAAALEAAREGSPEVGLRHLEAVRDRKILGGSERKGAVVDAEELRTIAYHEGGHALAALLQDGSDPVHKATIIARGQSLGHVARLPERDRVLVRRSKLIVDLVVAMAGRAAEEVVFGEENVTGGAASDIHEATRIAREMVARYGLGDSLTSRAADAFGVSEKTRRDVDCEAERIVQDCYARAKRMMVDERAVLDALAEALLARETLDGDELRAIVDTHRARPGAAVVAEQAA